MNSRRSRPPAGLAFTLLLLALFQCACSDRSHEQPSVRKDQTKVKIGGPKNISMLVLLANHQGYFENAGIDASFVPIQTGKLAMDALNAGDIDIAVMVDVNLAFVRFQGGDDIRVLCTIQEKRDDAIVARKDRGVRTPSDLKGKKVGYLSATTSHTFLTRFLDRNGLSVRDVVAVNMPPPAMQAALVRGDVDAISVWQPYRYNAMEALKDNGVELLNTVYTAYALLATRRDFLDASPGTAEKILRALLEAERSLSEHPTEARSYLSVEIPIDPQALETAWTEYTTRVRLDKSLLDLLNEEGAWIKQTQEGFGSKALPNYRDGLYPAPLRAIAADRVSLEP